MKEAAPARPPVKIEEPLIAYEEFNGVPLIPWPDVIKASHPGSLGHLSSMQRYRLEKAVDEFLLQKLKPEEVSRCRAATTKQNKIVPALPENLVEDFGDWMDEQMDAGMLMKANIEAWKKNNETPVKVSVYMCNCVFNAIC